MRRISSSTILIGVALSCGGCAHIPEPVATPNGEPLSVQEETKSYKTTVEKKVGQVKYKDRYGNTKKADVYGKEKKTVHYTTWSAYQGDTEISDDDFYRIAKDEEAVREVQSKRELGVLANRIGLVAAAAGILTAGAGAYLYNQTKDDENKSSVPTYLIIGGLVGFGLGFFTSVAGSREVEAKHPLPQTRAEKAAENYNKTLSGASSSDASE